METKKYCWKSLLLSLGLISIFIIAQAVNAQGQDSDAYKDPDGKYELQLPSTWKAVNYQDGAGNSRVDIVYRDRALGLLKITQESLSDNLDLEGFVRGDIDQNLRFRPGYVYNSIERFVGEFTRGQLLQFDFTLAGQPKKARNYYLKSKDSSVWVLRFTGNRDGFATLRHETDIIARSFKPLK